MKLSKSTYYYELTKKDAIKERNKHLLVEIKKIFKEHRNKYGVRRVYRTLIRRGFHVNHKRVQRLMHENGMIAQVKKVKYRSYQGALGKAANNIINRNFKATKPFEKCATDVTQFSFAWGKCYLSPVLDMYTNEIIAYDLSLTPNLVQVCRMLNKVWEKVPKTVNMIIHSDQGWQYQHEYYRKQLEAHGVIQFMAR